MSSLETLYPQLMHSGGNMSAPVADWLGSEAAPATLSNTYGESGTSDPIEVISNKYLIIFVYVSDASSAARLDMKIEVSENMDETGWFPLQAESVSAGAAVQEDYEIQKAFTEAGPVLAAAIPFRGFRFWRIKAKADSGSPQVYIRYSLAGGSL